MGQPHCARVLPAILDGATSRREISRLNAFRP